MQQNKGNIMAQGTTDLVCWISSVGDGEKSETRRMGEPHFSYRAGATQIPLLAGAKARLLWIYL